MKSFLISLFFVVVFMGVLFLMAASPFLIRDCALRVRRKKRQKLFSDSTEFSNGAKEPTIFDFSCSLCSKDFIKAVSLHERLHYPLYAKVVVTLLFGIWLVAGSHGIWKIITGAEPHTVKNWVRFSFGAIFGAWMLWKILGVPWLRQKSLKHVYSEERSQLENHDYVISTEGIRVSMNEDQSFEVGWDDVDHVAQEASALRVMLKSKDFLWIRDDAVFRSGEWQGLCSFLKPFMR